jgi:GNAT superfamily N-acetyltransferase
MNDFQTDVSPTSMVTAIEENLFAFFDLLKHAPQAEFHDDPDVLWSITDIPFPLFNPALRARLAATNVDAAIETAIARCQARNVPMLWWTSPSTQPPDLGAHLQAHDFIHADDLPGMAIDIPGRNSGIPKTSITVQAVDTPELLRTWCRVAVAGFGMPDFVIDSLYNFFGSVGFGPDVPIRHYLGLLGGQPVGTASMLLGAGVVGIYNVATLPQARHQGSATTLTLTALEEAGALGYRVGILHASSMGLGVYRRLGFHQYCTIGQYMWSPKPV